MKIEIFHGKSKSPGVVEEPFGSLKFFQKSSGAEIQAVQVADVLDEEEIPVPEFRVPAPLGGAHCTVPLK